MTYTAWQHIGWVGVAAAGLMTALWLLAWVIRDVGIVDVAWTILVGGVTVFFAMTADQGDVTRRILLAAMTAAWSLRLAMYVFTDRVLGKEEDGRYQNMRKSSGDWAQGVFLLWFLVQAGFVVVFTLPMLASARNLEPFGQWYDWAAILFWTAAVSGESIADAQLTQFRRDPANKGKTCRAGLWSWSRHPNYFFEWLHWWTYVFLAWGSGSLWWLAVLAGPVLMLLFLWYVTGIPYTEMQALKSRSDYVEYQRETSPFFPWPPRRGAPQ